MNCAIVGINWGDEGKGRMVDLIAADYDVVVRYQGGNNAGHTVVNEYGKFALHLLPSGIFRKGVVNVLGNGAVIDPEKLLEEMDELRSKGIPITPENLKVSDRAPIVFPYHRDQDALEEARLADAKYGSTKRGIAPVYGDKYMKKTIMLGELFYPEYLKKRLSGILEWKNLTLKNVYGGKTYSLDEIWEWLMTYGEKLKPFICDTGAYLRSVDGKKNILFEAQLGVLRDLDFGIFPYTSSSAPLAAYAPIGAGMPGTKIDSVVGVVKAYSTCVGEGPFTAEWFGEEASRLREAGAEYGAATGRPRRVGPMDIVATRYGVAMQGATEVALTKIDILSYMEQIPICVQYELNGVKTDDFPFPAAIGAAKPVIEYMPGWMSDVSKCRTFEELPKAAQDYILYIEKNIGCRISNISVGAARDEIIRR
ncbi:MAG: adenylosuccinate synthase [Eubacteriales bacterium]|nr:adenylosuccinate synthase [Eubacteriales bacterium]